MVPELVAGCQRLQPPKDDTLTPAHAQRQHAFAIHCLQELVAFKIWVSFWPSFGHSFGPHGDSETLKVVVLTASALTCVYRICGCYAVTTIPGHDDVVAFMCLLALSLSWLTSFPSLFEVTLTIIFRSG